MISIIICSIKPHLAEQLKENCTKNIGCDHEVIIFDNRESGYGICKVYNQCAEKAKGEYLCFIHEDTLISTAGWGDTITRKLDEPTCGVIGFAGSQIKSRSLSSWGQHKDYDVYHITQSNPSSGERTVRCSNHSQDFTPVISLDGVFLMMRQEVWNQCRFDEQYLQGFHCYDMDIALQVAQKYTNYVCNCVDLEHFSYGCFNHSWLLETIRIHDKWRDQLPIYVGNISQKDIEKNEQNLNFIFIKHILKSQLSRNERNAWLKRYFAEPPFTPLKLRMVTKYIKYSIQRFFRKK